MPIARKTQKIFAEVTPSGNISQFGSLKAGTPAYSDDPAVIQALAAWTQGWAGAVVGTNSPALQDFNAFCRVVTQQLAYVLQRGVPEWDVGTTYDTDCICSSGPSTYRSIQNGNIGHAVTDTSWWTNTVAVTPSILTGSITMYGAAGAPPGWLLCDGSSHTVASYPALAAVLGSLYGGDGVTNFSVPDLRGRTPVGITAISGGGVGTAPDATTWVINQKQGTETCALTANQNGPHTHSVPWAHGTNYGDYIMMLRGDDSQKGTIQTGTSGLGAAHNNLQPSIGMCFLIKT